MLDSTIIQVRNNLGLSKRALLEPCSKYFVCVCTVKAV